MRFMMLVKHGEIQAPPPKEFLDAMAKLGEEAEKSGTMVASGGLSPIAKSARVRLSRGQVNAVDGPFAESKEVVGGFAIFDLNQRKRQSKVLSASWNSTGNTGQVGKARPKFAKCSGPKPSIRGRKHKSSLVRSGRAALHHRIEDGVMSSCDSYGH